MMIVFIRKITDRNYEIERRSIRFFLNIRGNVTIEAMQMVLI